MRKQVLAMTGSVLFGIVLGVHSHPATETRTIRGPTVYKTRTVTDTQVKEVHVQDPLPDSCLKVMSLVRGVTNPLNSMSDSLGSVNLALQEFGASPLTSELAGTQASNDALTVIRVQRDKLDNSFISSLEAKQKLDSAYDQCRQDLG